MDTSEPSTNGISASNLNRLSSLLNDNVYSTKARETIAGFESEVLQYPWLYATFMPSIVASHLGIKGVVVASGASETSDARLVGKDVEDEVHVPHMKAFEKQPRGGLNTFAKISEDSTWLRGRNSLFKDLSTTGTTKVLICEGGVCKEDTGGLDVENLRESTAAVSIGDQKTKPI